MWDKETLKQFQVGGANLQSIMGGFGTFTLIASKFVLEEGIGTPDETMMAHFDPEKWYPLDRWVRVFDRIHAEFGNMTLRQVGMHVPKNAAYPPQIVDITTVIQFMDVAYHFNHGYNNQPMFNPQTGEMKDGIGHYKYLGATGPQRLSIEVNSPYPCPFDEGLLITASTQFKPSATVTHEKGKCRSKGADSCTYHISWK